MKAYREREERESDTEKGKDSRSPAGIVIDVK